MAAIQIVTRERHLGKKWLTRRNNSFAATITTTPFAGAELAECVRRFPLAFMEQDGRHSVVALLGLLRGQNLFVAPDGRWLGPYMPAVLSGYPFRIARIKGGTLALCVDEDSGLVKELGMGEEGFPFFDEEGQPHPETQKMAETLTATHRGILQMEKAAALLAELDLLAPWQLKVKVQEGEVERTIEGISRVNEAKLNALGGDELVKLRDGGALAVAYGQLLSMGNISILGTLGQVHQQIAGARAAQLAIPEGSFIAEQDDSLKIDWSKFLKDE